MKLSYIGNQSKILKILLLGQSGFIGRNLKEQLPYQLLTPSRKELDILDNKSVKEYKNNNRFDVIVNCINCRDNIQAYFNTLIFDKKTINLGSGAEFNKVYPIKNANEYFFNKDFPTDKYGQEKMLISMNAVFKEDKYLLLRLFGVFGKYEDSKRRFISKAILDNLKGKPITIYQNVKFSYIWVNDLVNIIDWFITHKSKYKSYNVGGHQMNLIEIAKKIGKYKVLKKGMANEYTCDDSRVRKETGIKYTPFDKSLEELRKYYANLC